MLGAYLKANLFVAFGHDRIIEAGRQDAMLSEVSD